jgi:ADP-ribosylglycohydrolase
VQSEYLGVRGAVLGEAIGDALGHPIEFRKTHKVVDLEVNNEFTDDTQMFCAIGEALVEAPPHINSEAFMHCVAKNFDNWRHNPLGGSHRAPGGNCMEAVRRLGAGVSWRSAGGLDFKGNGSAMRSGVVGAMYWKNPKLAFRFGCMTSVATHNNLESILGAGVVAYLVAASIRGDSFSQAVSMALMLCSEFENPEVVESYPRTVPLASGFQNQNPWYLISRFSIAYIQGADCGSVMSPANFVQLVGDHNSEFLSSRFSHIVADGAVVPAVAEAIFFNARFDTFEDIVLNAVNHSDDADTIGAISGTIAGARGLPIKEDWTNRIELDFYLKTLADRIWDISVGVPVQTAPQVVLDEVVDATVVDDILEITDDIEDIGIEDAFDLVSNSDEEVEF